MEGRETLPVNFSGRPLAIVHASLELAVSEERTETHEGTVEVQLGDLNRTLDGLIGYFIDGDYSQMYSVLETPVTHDSDSIWSMILFNWIRRLRLRQIRSLSHIGS